MKILGLIFVFVVSATSVFSQTQVTVGKKGVQQGSCTIKGVIRDLSAGESLVGATVYIPTLGIGTNSDLDGNYEIQLDRGEHIIQFSMLGFETKEYRVSLIGDGRLNIRLESSSLELDEVQITAEAVDHNVRSTDIGKQVLSLESIKELPAFVGEVDILKSITLLPGVSTVGEASSGFNIRGGSTDQNLILLGGAPLFNPSHLFGFFSAFNADAISRVTLYKGGVPPKFGGRGSSVLDINYKNGDLGTWGGNASIGSISSKAQIEGPIVRNKLSVLMGGRVSYVDWVLQSVEDPSIRNSSAFFYDTNGRVSYIVNDNNKVSYTHYRSADEFSFDSDTSLNWSNKNHILEWNYSNGKRLSIDATLIKANYENTIKNNSNVNQFDLNTGVDNAGGSIRADIALSDEMGLNVGFESILTEVNPGELVVENSESSLNPKAIEKEKAIESAAFADIQFNLHKNLRLTAGLRYNVFNYLGEKTINSYEPYVPRSVVTITDSTTYGSNESIITYDNFDPRFTLRWSLSSSTSIKAAYNRMHQYIHLISNTSAIAPNDIWKLSDPYLQPQIVTQYSLGLFKNFRDNTIETSLEVYYKDADNLVQYKDGADLILSENIETELVNGIGRAYGVELYFKKKKGRLNGWVSYTYSRSFVKVDGAYDIERINEGEWFNSNFDKPHDFTAVTIYEINNQWSMSGNFTFSTGRPVTYPSAKIFVEGNTLAYFDERNGSRIPDYMRLDFSMSFQPESRRKIWGGEWKFSVYNVLGRRNAFSVFFRDELGQPPQPYKLSVMGSAFPSLSYEFNF